MFFPVTGFPCNADVQSRVRADCVFEKSRFQIGDFGDCEKIQAKAGVRAPELFIAKAALLCEILYAIFDQAAADVEVPARTRRAGAKLLGISDGDCSPALLGLIWFVKLNPLLQPLMVCLKGYRKISGLDFLEQTPLGQRIVRLVAENATSLDAQLELFPAEFPSLFDKKGRLRMRQLLRYEAGAQFAGGNGSFTMIDPASSPAQSISRSTDQPWMKNLVLLAKIVPLWLADLSRRYGRGLQRLDEIPEAEIAGLAAFGINGIWLVGLWQRSAASARIKAKTGGKNYASAYSVFDYEVAPEWGGNEALRAFRQICERHGIVLGCDMVPNHAGIDSRWIRENPDWFMQTNANPFPGYSFQGENLSADASQEIRLEDHYYNKSDAAVVFAHDKAGRRRYIYHGNDGTGLPWNDTAQLDHTRSDVRKALIDTALHLAENFKIIRFDAAMTLTRDNYRRLWFPDPDQAPAIASRSVFGLRDFEFNERMPGEFWTELVSEFRSRSADTLLIAEAFWMTEMFFVRQLGLHRVYNSAFMHALRDEKNAEFEATLKKFAESDADTLTRFVNYLSTPDEESAAAHFPSVDKYFGALTLMATLPGLPLFAPGQLEGYHEKYSMDQDTPYLHEVPDKNLQERFLRQITPLLKKRHEFTSGQTIAFPRCHKSSRCIVYTTGITERHLVMFNNSPQRERLTLEAGEFGRDEFTVELAAYEARVLSDADRFKAEEKHPVAEAVSSTASYPTMDRYYAGVAVPVSALRSEKSCGIGEFGDLHLLVDWCAATAQHFINILPVNDTGLNSSPYSALSAMALHPVYLRLDELDLPQTLRTKVAEFRIAHRQNERVRFVEVVRFKEEILLGLYRQNPEAALAQVPEEFRRQKWLQDYAVYKFFKAQFGGQAWYEWPDTAGMSPETGFYVWVQYLLHVQLSAAKAYADERGVFLKGDMPIMLERDSVDVWLNPELFNHRLRAGAPPDMFSPQGQNWGFPVYNWEAHRRENFAWWKTRIQRLSEYFSAYRIDHVLGFFRLWCIDEKKSDGADGVFLPADRASQQAQGMEILSVLAAASKMLPCAEDLGVVPDYVGPALAQLKILSLKVYRWAGENGKVQNPATYPFLSLATSSVHDSSNLREWLAGEGAAISGIEIADGNVSAAHVENFLRRIYASGSMIAMIPLQDLLAIEDKFHGDPAAERINVPGTVSDFNWTYRMPLLLEDLLKEERLGEKIRGLTALRTGRSAAGQ